eukprot:7162424-Prymnesium_polylepis.1
MASRASHSTLSVGVRLGVSKETLRREIRHASDATPNLEHVATGKRTTRGDRQSVSDPTSLDGSRRLLMADGLRVIGNQHRCNYTD